MSSRCWKMSAKDRMYLSDFYGGTGDCYSLGRHSATGNLTANILQRMYEVCVCVCGTNFIKSFNGLIFFFVFMI